MTDFDSTTGIRARIAEIQSRDGYKGPVAYALGWSFVTIDGDSATKLLDADFHAVNFQDNAGVAALLSEVVSSGRNLETGFYHLTEKMIRRLHLMLMPFRTTGGDHPNLDTFEIMDRQANIAPFDTGLPNRRRAPVLAVIMSLDDAPVSVPDAYLRLYLLSMRHVKPHKVNLSDVFKVLNNVVWTNFGPVDPDHFDELRRKIRAHGKHIHVYSVDKFPRMLDYYVPSGVRIGDGARVRLGAYLGEGTTVMHEGFVNFNAGTEGPGMVEGRISAGVLVGPHSDLGGSSSTMGTLSGGGNEVISVGHSCLLGANSGIGISLGDHCTVEAGLYITAGTPVTLITDNGEEVLKARRLSGRSNLLFRRNGLTGRIEAIFDASHWSGLNESLHVND